MKIIQTKKHALRRQRSRKDGLAMMEYVMLGTVIAAATLVAAIFFGDAIRAQFKTMTGAVAVNVSVAEAGALEAQAKGSGVSEANDTYRKKIILDSAEGGPTTGP